MDEGRKKGWTPEKKNKEEVKSINTNMEKPIINKKNTYNDYSSFLSKNLKFKNSIENNNNNNDIIKKEDNNKDNNINDNNKDSNIDNNKNNNAFLTSLNNINNNYNYYYNNNLNDNNNIITILNNKSKNSDETMSKFSIKIDFINKNIKTVNHKITNLEDKYQTIVNQLNNIYKIVSSYFHHRRKSVVKRKEHSKKKEKEMISDTQFMNKISELYNDNEYNLKKPNEEYNNTLKRIEPFLIKKFKSNQ